MAVRSLEEDMLRAIAYHHPIDHIKLERILEEWRGGEVEFETFKAARSNLTDLDLIEHPKMEEYYYLTEVGWRQLGAETPLDDGTTWSTSLY